MKKPHILVVDADPAAERSYQAALASLESPEVSIVATSELALDRLRAASFDLSEFNPEAISHANAFGLMQVLPSTGRKLARSMKVHGFSNQQLLVPNFNLQLGTRYFRELVDHFNGHVEYALAAYNAGSDRVESWLANGKYRDATEFVESIPFSETREYVQAILRNATVYKRLYGTP